MCYSTDMLKKFTFQREIEHLRSLPLDQQDEKICTLVEYMTKELDRIETQYGDEPTRS